MSYQKRWSYAQVTREAESEITRLVQQEAKNPDERHLLTCMAMGAFAMWDHLTSGWQDVGDRERLQALYQPSGKA
ncbi:hypothetical protein BZM26_10140 [Paraburkholderia strydomiana]|nr:hypothetical protein BZM26_10140 [Paraburkholderia strydomiana]